jgi:hypothetical protein
VRWRGKGVGGLANEKSRDSEVAQLSGVDGHSRRRHLKALNSEFEIEFAFELNFCPASCTVLYSSSSSSSSREGPQMD